MNRKLLKLLIINNNNCTNFEIKHYVRVTTIQARYACPRQPPTTTVTTRRPRSRGGGNPTYRRNLVVGSQLLPINLHIQQFRVSA